VLLSEYGLGPIITSLCIADILPLSVSFFHNNRGRKERRRSGGSLCCVYPDSHLLAASKGARRIVWLATVAYYLHITLSHAQRDQENKLRREKGRKDRLNPIHSLLRYERTREKEDIPTPCEHNEAREERASSTENANLS
jgi:hypothetical protein